MEDYAPGYFESCECCRVYGPRQFSPTPTQKIFYADLSNVPVEQLQDFVQKFNKTKKIEKESEAANDDQMIKVALEKSLRGLEEKAQQINETRELLRDIQQKQREKEAVKKQKETYSMDPYRKPVDQTAFDKANETEIAMRALETAMADKQEEDRAEQKVVDMDKRIDKLETMMINMAKSLTEIRAMFTAPIIEEKPMVSDKDSPIMVSFDDAVVKEAVSGGSLSYVKQVGTILKF